MKAAPPATPLSRSNVLEWVGVARAIPPLVHSGHPALRSLPASSLRHPASRSLARPASWHGQPLPILPHTNPWARARGLREQTPPRYPCHPGQTVYDAPGKRPRLSVSIANLVRHVTVPQFALGAFIAAQDCEPHLSLACEAGEMTRATPSYSPAYKPLGASPGTAGTNATPLSMPSRADRL